MSNKAEKAEPRLPHAILSGLPDAAVAFDAQLRPSAFNDKYVELSRVARRTLRNRVEEAETVTSLIVSDDAKYARAAMTCVRKGRVVTLASVTLRTSGGHVFDAYVSFVPVHDAEGKSVGGIQIVRDLSAQEDLKLRLRRDLDSAEARVAELEQIVEARTQELRMALEEVMRLSHTDALTGLANRRAFAEIAEQSFSLARRHTRTAALILCDLDDFSTINNDFGHSAGDALLVAVANALRYAVRKSDHVVRFGGEKFLILLTETHPSHVIDAAQRCRRAISALPVHELIRGRTQPQTASLGIAVFPYHAQDLAELTAKAELALEHAKRSGRDRVVLYDPALQAGGSTEPKGRLSGLAEDGVRS